MKPSTFLLLLLFSLSCTAYYYSSEGLDYILGSIEYEASVESGTLSLVLFDLDPRNAFDNVLGAILQSPRLSHIVKYVINGADHQGLERLPRNPSMLLMHAGNDMRYLMRDGVMEHFVRVMQLFNPSTKALVFVDFSRLDVVRHVFLEVYETGFASTVLYDCRSMRADLWNRINSVAWRKAPAPMYLFTWMRRSMSGVNITYYGEEKPMGDMDWNVNWIHAAAGYLNTEASEYRTYCENFSGAALNECVEKQADELANVDLLLDIAHIRPDRSREFAGLATNNPIKLRVAIPRDRPLNIAELMVMPFSWKVWLLLVSVLAFAEIVRQLFPKQFKNDPTLLVVCGYERYNLHQASALEKTVLLSLIIVMFFVSNAFETKMLSMMVSKPSIQRIKTVDDLLMSDIKFYDDLEAKPYLVNQSIFGRILVQGSLNAFDTIPGVGMMTTADIADILEMTAYDYERMQPWYVLLDFEYLSGFEFFQTRWRYENIEILRYVHELLIQAGIINHWKRQFREVYRAMCIGRRQRVEIDNKVDLNFEDMQPAWVILAIGWIMSILAFLGERIRKSFQVNFNGQTPVNSVEIFDYE